MDEKELSCKIRDYLNKNSLEYEFEFIDDFCDLADTEHKIYIEVKLDHFAPAQILHAIVKQEIKDAKLLGVADINRVDFYRPPSFDRIMGFVRSFDPTLTFTPSNVDKPSLHKKAFEILGEPSRTVKFKFQPEPFQFITQENVRRIKPILDKYRIDVGLFVSWLDGAAEHESVRVNSEGWIVNMDRPDEFEFTNERREEWNKRQLNEFGGTRKPNHSPIKKAEDVSFFESLRIRHADLADVLHEVDRMLPRKSRRKRGVFWTEPDLGDMLANEVMELTQPDYVVEPCVGGGSLVNKIVREFKVKGAMNDIDPKHLENCKKIFEAYEWKFTNLDVVSTTPDALLSAWGVPSDSRLLLYTNPPFGTAATNQLVSKKLELEGEKSRKQLILYPTSLKKYGKGDLFIPIAGSLIELSKLHRNTCLAIFSPFSLFTVSERYKKVLGYLLNEFKLLRGYVFAGSNFHDINETIPVGFSVWEFQTGREFATEQTDTFNKLLDFTFEFKDKNNVAQNIGFKKMPLLKDGWRYDRRDKDHLTGEIVVQHCEVFHAPAPKVFHMNPRQGGSEVIPQNVKIPLGIPNVPDELAYALWGISVAVKNFGTSLSDPIYPIYMGRAYVHMPDFSRDEALEILVYSALYSVVDNYAHDRIGFIGANKVFKFGGERLTAGVEFLFDKFSDLQVYEDFSMKRVLLDIRNGVLNKTKFRKGIREEVSRRLNQIGYWDYIPIP